MPSRALSEEREAQLAADSVVIRWAFAMARTIEGVARWVARQWCHFTRGEVEHADQ